jgi:hypothetical protein
MRTWLTEFKAIDARTGLSKLPRRRLVNWQKKKDNIIHRGENFINKFGSVVYLS